MATRDLLCPACGARFQAPDVGSVGTLPRCPYCEADYPAEGAAAADVVAVEAPAPGQPRAAGAGVAPRPAARRGRDVVQWVTVAVAGAALLTSLVVIGIYLWPEPEIEPMQPPGITDVAMPPPVGVPGGTGGVPGAPGAIPMPTDWPFATWHQDLQRALQQAAAKKKDVLILFDSSDSNHLTPRLARDVLTRPAFRDPAGGWFELVFIDFAQGAQAAKHIEDRKRNRATGERYLIFPNRPTFLLTDARGRPYGVITGLLGGGLQGFMQLLADARADRVTRDRLLAEVARAEGDAKLRAVHEAIDFLAAKKVLWAYDDELVEVVRRLDPRNERGELEAAFAAGCLARLDWCGASFPDGFPAVADRLEAWEKAHRFKDGNRAALIHQRLADSLWHSTPQGERAGKHLKAAADARPTDPEIGQRLATLMFQMYYGAGAGFVAAPGGYVLTTHYAVVGPGRLLVRWPGGAEPVAAEVVAEDEGHDVALVHAPPPAGVAPPPVPLEGGRPPALGEGVVLLAPPVGSAGGELKRIPGVVSALPVARNGNVLVIDAQFKPADRGGLVCDAFGNAVGLATFRSAGGLPWGNRQAVPAGPLAALARKAIPDYRPSAPGTRKLAWEEVERAVGASVVTVYRSP